MTHIFNLAKKHTNNTHLKFLGSFVFIFSMKYFKYLLKRSLWNNPFPNLNLQSFLSPVGFILVCTILFPCLQNKIQHAQWKSSTCFICNLEKKKPNQIPLLAFSLFYVLPKIAMHGESLLFLYLCNHGLTEDSPGVVSQFSSHQQLFPQNFSHCQVCCTLWINPH